MQFVRCRTTNSTAAADRSNFSTFLQVEQNIAEIKSRKAEQKAKLDKLRGTTDPNNKS